MTKMNECLKCLKRLADHPELIEGRYAWFDRPAYTEATSRRQSHPDRFQWHQLIRLLKAALMFSIQFLRHHLFDKGVGVGPAACKVIEYGLPLPVLL